MMQKLGIRVEVNGTLHEGEVEPRLLLADYLRNELGLTGNHLGCEHGVCGACTILMDGKPVRSCTTFAVQADALSLLGVEINRTPLTPERILTGIEQAQRANQHAHV